MELDLAGDAAVLRFKFSVLSQASALNLQGPAFTWLGEAEPYPDRHFPELEARVQGTVLAPGKAFKAAAGPHDVTADVSALGLDPFVIAKTPPLLDPPPAADSVAFKRLLSRRAVELTEGQVWARWQARRLWHFELPPSPAGSALDFQRSFTARPGMALVPTNTLARSLPLASYCISAAQLRDRLTALGLTTESLVARTYVIATGVDGSAPRSLTARVSEPGTFFCGTDGRPAHGGAGSTPARADRAGVLRVLRLDKPG